MNIIQKENQLRHSISQIDALAFVLKEIHNLYHIHIAKKTHHDQSLLSQ